MIYDTLHPQKGCRGRAASVKRRSKVTNCSKGLERAIVDETGRAARDDEEVSAGESGANLANEAGEDDAQYLEEYR